jgi:hypothetical protein
LDLADGVPASGVEVPVSLATRPALLAPAIIQPQRSAHLLQSLAREVPEERSEVEPPVARERVHELVSYPTVLHLETERIDRSLQLGPGQLLDDVPLGGHPQAELSHGRHGPRRVWRRRYFNTDDSVIWDAIHTKIEPPRRSVREILNH